MPRHSSNRPIIEKLSHIGISDIAKVIPRNPNEIYCLDSFGLRYGGAKVRVCNYVLEITNTTGYKQVFRIKWIKTYFGRHRPLLVCNDCKRNYQILYEYYGRWACRRCLKATYLSERVSHHQQRRWKAARLRLKNGGTPTESLRRPRYKHRNTYQRIQDQIHYLEMKARKARNKQFDVKLLAYHLQ
jgi:hypothetical protein